MDQVTFNIALPAVLKVYIYRRVNLPLNMIPVTLDDPCCTLAQGFSYLAYGLHIRSSFPIPEFVSGGSGSDLTIEVDSDRTMGDYVPPAVAAQSLALRLSREEAVVYLQGAGVFIITDGCHVVIIPGPGASPLRIRRCLTGTIMAIVLYQRGLFILHASAVRMTNAAVMFLGHSGEGKSSWAGALHAQGYGFVTDDVAAVCLEPQPVTLAPSFPQLKLSPEMATALGYADLPAQPTGQVAGDKREYRLVQPFGQEPLPIQHIYVLASGPELQIEPLVPHEGLMALMCHSALAPFLDLGEAEHFLQCAALVKACPVYRLQRPHNLSLLPELARLTAEHFTSDCQPAKV